MAQAQRRDNTLGADSAAGGRRMSMERLTARTENGNAYLVNVKPDEQEVDSPYKNTLQCILDCFERLAAYEDTGLDPEEVAEMARAKADGRLVVLPCKVGDTVYKHWRVGGKTEIGSALVTGFEIANDGINYCYRVKRFDRKETIKKFGKTVFLTRAEAEAALAQEGGQDDE